MEAEEILRNVLPEPTDSLARCRKWFQSAVDSGQRWREEAKEDYEFMAGKQWTDKELETFHNTGRPTITINRIKPLLNILSGYQRLNRYDIDFLGRTNDDVELCQVRRGITKYVMDRCDYDTVESQVFMDCAIGGVGWFNIRYKFDHEIQDGEAVIERVDPFGLYVDPEAHELDFSDAKFLILAKWVGKDELKQVYPEQADAIENNFALYDTTENESEQRIEIDPLYYSGELKKVRVVECWYKERELQQVATATGQIAQIPVTAVKLCVFFDRTLLEEIPSPYQHGEFPYVPMLYHYYGVGDTPAGFVRDLKDPQRELNKRRVQELHLLDTSANGGGFIEEGAMTPDQESEFKRMNNIPGHYQKVLPTALTGGKIQEREPKNPPAAIIQAQQQSAEDLKSISGINESLLGVDVPSQASGRAIELRQKQAVTHLATIFDNLRRAKKKIANLLWGRRGHAGVIPQFYTAEKVYRVEGENGQQFVTVNEQIAVQDPVAGTIIKTMNDLSQGEFDIVIADVEASTTQRQAQMLTLVDAVSRLGVPGDLVFDIILDLSDVPHKEEIKQRWQQRQESQAKAAQDEMQMKLQLEEIRNQDSRQVINFKDAPPPIQLAMAAKAGYIDSGVVERVLQNWIQATFPQEAAEQQAEAQAQAQAQAEMQAQMPPEMQGQSPENLDQMIAFANMMSGQGQAQPQQGRPLTQAATESLMRGMTPAI